MMLALEALIKTALVIGGLMTIAAYLVLLERKMAAWTQDRIGPNRVGVPLTRIRLFGLGQPLADGLKFILKEEYTPAHVDKRLYWIAPIAILAAALGVFAVIPFGGTLPVEVGGRPLRMIVVPDMDVGLIYIFALSSMAVYGVILGGWSSNNKYSFLGGLRSSAQLIAYELPLGLGILGVVLVAGSLDLEVIIEQQARGGWNGLLQPLGFTVFLIAAFAEAARAPFDLPECEQELVAGYHTEYSGVKLLLFLVSEFLHMIAGSLLIVILFLGGWHLPWIAPADAEPSWLGALLRCGILMTKMLIVVMCFMWIRWSWPRFRFDQLMSLGWKVMLPLGLVNFVVVAILDQISFSMGWSAWMTAPVSWAAFVIGWLVVARYGMLITDNRPQQELGPSAIDAQI